MCNGSKIIKMGQMSISIWILQTPQANMKPPIVVAWSSKDSIQL